MHVHKRRFLLGLRMLEWNIKKLPVVDEGKLVGIVTLTDLLRSDGVVEVLNGCALNGVDKHLKKTLEIYFDDGLKRKTRRCPLLYKDGMALGCRLNKCMWWTGDECAITQISRNMEHKQLEVAVQQNEKEC